MERLTKSLYLKGRQCPLRFWLAAHGHDEPAMESEDVWEDRTREGAAVEAQAESLYENPVRIAACPEDDEEDERSRPGWDPVDAARRTVEAMREADVVFQPCFLTDNALAVADIAQRVGDAWRLIEVKASTEIVALHDWDLAYQWVVAERCGVRVSEVGVWHLNRDYVRSEDPIDPRALLRYADRTKQASRLLKHVREEIDELLVLISGEMPAALPGSRCKAGRKNKAGNRPSACGHLDATSGRCGSKLPKHWAGHLPRLGGKKAELVYRTPGLSLIDLDAGDPGMGWTPKQARAIRASKSGQPEIEKSALAAKLDELVYPVAYVDFEFDPGVAIPRYPGTRPYSRLPFQWSMHVHEAPGADLAEREPFLHLEPSDPRGPFVESLLAALPNSGSVVVHSKAAEQTVLNQLAEFFAGESAERLEALKARLYDTIELLEAGFYHPDQEGSYSIKRVAPLLCGRGYEDLAIGDGMAAVIAWRAACGDGVEPAERERARADLLAYCGRDTELMHGIVEAVRGMVAG